MSKILVVDDDPNNRYLVVVVLEAAGHIVLEAADVSEGLRIAREHHPDLIIMDLHLPGISGTAFIKALRSEADVANTKVVLYTGTSPTAAMRDFMELSGIEHLIPKPSEPAEIVRIVNAALGDRDCEDRANLV
jgi:two-component system cell cycle response regulator DivK